LSKIREEIAVTLRPVWQAALPDTFGSPEHGKLKADQWRTVMEFDIPVSLIRALALRKPTGHIGEDARFHQFHAEKYTFYMRRYLAGIRTLYPDYILKPNHHYALHIPDILTLFGPLHGTWAFFLERLIGRLQKMNTNCKIGDMENTAMHTFCRRSSLIRLMESSDCPAALRE
ncbi:hypothetical protein GALMADRAFT_42003, partial [Galerina marginata CBS 339.88]